MSSPSLDTIIIQGLKAECIIGDYDWEREKPQRVILDLEMSTDISIAASTDSLSEDTLDYAKVAAEVLLFVKNSSFQLIETLAEGVATLCLSKFPIQSIKVRLNKPKAILDAEATIIEIFRSRSR